MNNPTNIFKPSPSATSIQLRVVPRLTEDDVSRIKAMSREELVVLLATGNSLEIKAAALLLQGKPLEEVWRAPGTVHFLHKQTVVKSHGN